MCVYMIGASNILIRIPLIFIPYDRGGKQPQEKLGPVTSPLKGSLGSGPVLAARIPRTYSFFL
jgi:hypothetical protein